MYGNGAGIGMELTPVVGREIPRAFRRALSGFHEVGAGTSMLAAVGLRTVSATTQTSGTTALGSVLCPMFSNLQVQDEGHKITGNRV